MQNITGAIEYSVPYRFFKPVVFGILTILVIGGNTLCLVVLKRNSSHLKTPTRLFLTSMTCADLSAGLFTIFPLFAVYTIEDVLPTTVAHSVCTTTGVTFMFSCSASIVSLLCVNFDRYIAIEYPLTCETIVTARRARITIACLWMIGLLMTIAGCFVLLTNTDFESDLCNGFYDFDRTSILVMSVGVFIGAFVPFLITTGIYTRIIVIVNRHKKMLSKLGGESITGASIRKRLADRKALNTFLLVTVISCSTWIPSFVFALCNYFLFESSANPFIDITVHAIAMSTFWINILIYTCRDQSFRKGAFKLFFCK